MASGSSPEGDESVRPARRAGAGRRKADRATTNGEGHANGHADPGALRELLSALTAARDGDFGVRLATGQAGVMGEIAAAYNDFAETNARLSRELVRVGNIIGREGRMQERASLEGAKGDWAASVESVNTLVEDLVRPTTEVARVIDAVAEGDLTQQMALTIEGLPVKGEFLRIGKTVNGMVDQLSSFASEVTRVAREVGTDGNLGGQAHVGGVSGTWKDLTDNVNFMASNLTDQVRSIAQVTTAVAEGDLSQKINVEAKGEVAALADTINTMVDQLSSFADEVTRVAREVGTEGQLGGQAEVAGVSGTWRDLTESVNLMAGNLTDQVRNISQVATAVALGDLSQKITVEAKGEVATLADTINTMVDQLSSFADEVTRVAREVGTEGKLGGQAEVAGVSGTWRDLTENVNLMAGNLTDQVRNIAQVATAVAQGDLTQTITVEAKGEVAALADTINSMTGTLAVFADQVTGVAREVGTEGILGGQAQVPGVSGTWKDLTDNVNFMASNLTDQVRSIAQVTTAVAEGDLSQKINVEAKGEVAALADTINTMVDQLSSFADEVTRVAREVGTEGQLGGQAEVAGVSGTWRDLTESVNLMAGNLTDQVRNISQVATAVALGDLSQKITVEAKGEVATLADTINTMVDQLSSFADEVTRVAREVGTEGKLGGQAEVEDVSGTWRDLTENVNLMASNLTDQVRDIAVVATAVANGDLSRKITVDAKGEILELKQTINTMVEQLRSFAAEVTRVAREVGTEGRLGGQAQVEDVSGTWRGLTENVNLMASNLTDQVRNIADVATAVARGDLSQKITVDAKGEILELKDTINTMVDRLRSFAAEVTRVAREVGTEGRLGGQAEVEDVSGTWRGLTENVNLMAGNLTDQVRDIAEVATAVASGDLSKKITVDAKGEILELKDTINTMVDQLSSFADEVTRVAKEVGTEGKLGGQAQVEGVAGTWRGLTENVNQLASNLTTQVRAIAEVSTAVTQGDLTRSITVDAQGEVADLKDNINQMIANLRETTARNEEQDWLKTNLGRISSIMQGQRDLQTVTRMIMSELTPTVAAQHGVFYLADTDAGEDPELRLIASYGYQQRKHLSNRFRAGEGLVGQTALEKKSILITDAPPDYIKISSGLGEASPVNIIDLPVLFEDQVLGVIELASFRPFSEVHRQFLDQLMETIGVVLSTIIANMRTEQLLQQSQQLAHELQSQSEELQTQQDELKRSNQELEEQAQSLKASEELLQTQQEELRQTNDELQDKAAQLAQQNRDIEVKNHEIELARASLEEKAAQLTLSSKYKSEFLANMSHELRTPLNSLLILSKLLADNETGNLDPKQVEYARTIHAAGSDLLGLISDILDLSKVEAGKMDVHPRPVRLAEVTHQIERSFRPLADDKGLALEVELAAGLPETVITDEQRLHQILKNLLANALKFTEQGSVRFTIAPAPAELRFADATLAHADQVIALSVADTGIGIREENLRLIFEAFQQADGTTSRRFGGTGLGLSISREIARLLGGEIRVESTFGEGSTFTLYLPAVYRPRRDDEPVEPEPEPDGPPRARLRHEEDEAALPAAPVVAALPASEIADDRDSVQPGDRVLLIAEGDREVARMARDAARARGLRALVALRADHALALAHDFAPDAILLDAELPVAGDASLLDHLKRRPQTRHIPVHVVSARLQRQEALKRGALGHLERPVTEAALESTLDAIEAFIERRVRRVLIVEDDERERQSVAELIGRGDDVEITGVGSSEEALERLAADRFDCMVLDLSLPEMTGFALLEELRRQERFRDLPVIVHTGRELTRQEETELKRYADTIVVKDGGSPERLLDETALFLHRSAAALPADQRRALEELRAADSVFEGKKVLIVDDDVRNVFALVSVLEERGMDVSFAENGREGIAALEAADHVDIVLMDVMMPEMDGYETMRAIRSRPEFRDLPIVALTAKAMKGDREKSIAAGASDYVTKPVDVDQLLSLMRVWLYG